MSENINNENRIEKEPKLKALYIDNEKPMVDLIKFTLGNRKDIISIVCNTVEEALDAIYKYNPDILFLDNFLKIGNEGVEVVNKIKDKNIEIYSLSSNSKAFEQYGDRIKGRVEKNDYEEIEKIINKSIADNKK